MNYSGEKGADVGSRDDRDAGLGGRARGAVCRSGRPVASGPPERDRPSLTSQWLCGWGGALVWLLIGLVTGCENAPPTIVGEEGPSKDEIRAELQACRQQGLDQQRQIEQLQQQLSRQSELTPECQQQLVRVDDVAIGRFSRGIDTDDDGDDDGVKVYVVLRGRDGEVIKAAGELSVELWDLAQPEGDNYVVGREFSCGQAMQQWLGGAMARHYRVILEWPQKAPPRHEALTVKVTFIDALTGRQWHVQELITVALPAAEGAGK